MKRNLNFCQHHFIERIKLFILKDEWEDRTIDKQSKLVVLLIKKYLS